MSPECTVAIDAYLQFRERHFEQLTPESPLIREEFDTVSLIRKKPKHVTRMLSSGLFHNYLTK